jgi:phosphatidylinositol glycan class M
MALSLSTKQDVISILLDLKNPARMRFVAGTVLTFAFLTGLFYWMYGEEFLEETYLYHITR